MVQRFFIHCFFLTRFFWVFIFLFNANIVLPVFADVAPQSQPKAMIPNYWDPHLRREKLDLKDVRIVRILTDDDYPPFSMQNNDGSPTGFSVELAREACQLLAVPCEIQIRPFETLLDSLDLNKGDVVISALQVSTTLRGRYAMTAPYFRNPGRFMALKSDSTAPNRTRVYDFKGVKIAVVSGSSHEVFVKTFFPNSVILGAPDFLTATNALKNGQVAFVFADGVSAALWVNGKNSENCCVLTWSAFLDSRYFGEGFAFTMRKKDERLRQAFDYAFQQMYLNGKYKELYLRFFPLNPH